MPASFTFEGKPYPYIVNFDGSSIGVQIDGKVRVRVATPLKLGATSRPDDFDTYLLTRPDVRENDVKQVFSKIAGDRARIGWAIPVLSLVSDEHDSAADPHFLNYAYVAMMKAVEMVQATTELEVSELSELDILNMLGENSVILVISRATLKEGHDFELRRALPSLVSQGYAICAPEVDVSGAWVEVAGHQGHIKITLSTKMPDDHDMVVAMLNGFVSSTRSAALQFFYLYQIVELLMERVISIHQKEIAESILKAGDSSSLIRGALEKIGELNSERSRLNLVVEKYSRVAGDLRDLKLECNKLKVKLGLDAGESISEYLYPLRNYIFHNFRSFPKDAEPELRAVVTALLSSLPIFLSKFDSSSM
ncbi:hypothetical protein [Stenotrophomonas sp. NPDC077461]|uniref:hypothetical protein n=1 Tax=Stenotrophomonas sp. NPDC077461 TaxID=3414698 RepID=UPI003C2E993B